MNISVRPKDVSARPIGTMGTELIDWRRDTLVDLLERRAHESPDAILYTFLEDGETKEHSIKAADLAAAARGIGQRLASLAEPGARVILLFEDGLDAIAGLFGCLFANLTAVSGIHPAAPRGTERLVGIVRDCKATIVLGQARVLAEFQRALDDVIDDLDLSWVASDMIKPSRGTAWVPNRGANGDVALIQYTSGSSREPRGVMLSHRNILHNLRSQVVAFGCRQGDTGCSWLPFSHDMGLIGCVLMPIYGGGRCILLAPSHFLEDPLRWLRAISRYRATLSAAPNFAYDLCARRAETAGLGDLDLSSWVVAVNGAEPIRAEVVRRFAETFAPVGFRADAIHPSYGLAEATLLVATGERLAPLATLIVDKAGLQSNVAVPADIMAGVELVSCGSCVPDQDLAIVDPETLTAVAPGRVGEIWIAGPSISKGYFDRPDDNAALFTGDLGDGLGPYYRTGDLGFVMDDALYVTGRLRDLLIIRGKNYYPQDLELSAEASHPAVRPASSACFLQESGDLVVVSELNRSCMDDAPAAAIAIRDAIIRDHGVNPRCVVLTAWGSALKTPSGKIQRPRSRAAYADGKFAIVHESIVTDAPRTARTGQRIDPAKVEDWFVVKMREMGVDIVSFDPAMRLTDLGFDSLKIVELKADLEQDLGIAINISDLYAFQDLGSLAAYLRTEAQGQRTGVKPSVPAVTARATSTPNRLAEQRQRRGARVATSGSQASL